MNYSTIESDQEIELELVATFGMARIIQWSENKFRLEGGSAEDRKNARQWAAKFLDVRFPPDALNAVD